MKLNGSMVNSIAASIVLFMNLKAVADTARQHICDLFAADAPRDIRLETWLYDDHLMVWSLTIGFTPSNDEPATRTRKLVRVSEADKSVLSIRDA
jgi:hypothetical protein